MNLRFWFGDRWWILGVALVLLSPLFFWLSGYVISTYSAEYSTNIDLGRSGAGASFKTAQEVIANTVDVILRNPPENLVRKYGDHDIRSRLVIRSIDSGRAVQLETSGSTSSTEFNVEVHRFVVRRILASLATAVTIERSRIDGRIAYLQDNLRGLMEEKARSEAILAEIGGVKEQTSKLKRDLITRNSSDPAASQPGGSGRAADVTRWLALRDLLDITNVKIPLQEGTLNVNVARLDREVAKAKSDLLDMKLELERFSEPKASQIAVPRAYLNVGALVIRIILACLGAVLVGAGIYLSLGGPTRRGGAAKSARNSQEL